MNNTNRNTIQTTNTPTRKWPYMLKRRQAAELLGIGLTHMTELIESGIIRAIDVGKPGALKRCYRIPIKEIQRFMTARLIQ